MANSSAVTVKDMVLRCLIQMIQARGDNIRSGWKAMFGAFTVAAREPYGKQNTDRDARLDPDFEQRESSTWRLIMFRRHTQLVLVLSLRKELLQI
jgi:Sec7-like guanine-nucleotide exchange factor